MSIRFSFRPFATLALAVGVATCSDTPNAVVKTAPDAQRGTGRFSIAPRFSPQAAAVYAQRATFAAVNFDRVRILITRPPNEVVIDTVVTFNPSSPTLTLDLFVDVKTSNEIFDGVVQYTNNGAVVYEAKGKVRSYPPDQVAPAPQDMVVVYVGPGANATRLTVSPATSTVVSPGVAQFTAVAFDAQNQAVNDVPIAWSVSDASIATLSTTSGPSTTVTPTGRRGTVTVTATGPSPALTGSGSLTVSLPPAGIVLVSGGGQTGKAGSTLAAPAVVRVVASDGIAVPGVSVQFAAPTGGGVGSASAVTNAEGQASSTLTLGGMLGAQSFAASAAGFSVSIPATATPGDPATIVALSGQNQSDTVSRALRAPFVVKVSDRFGNGVPSVVVTWARTSGGGTLSGTSSTTDADGNASIGYTLGPTPGPETITATAAGLATPATFTATAVTAPAGISIVSGNGQSGRINQPLAAPLVVKVVDAGGGAVSGAVVTWIATNGTVVAGAPTDAQGQTSASMTLGGTVGAASATATVGTGANAKSVTFAATVQPGTVARIVFRTPPSNAAAAAVIAPPIEVELQDASGNRTNAVNGVTLALGANPGQATLGGTLTRAAVNGVATFNDITVSAAGTGYTLVAASAGVSNITSPAFDIGAAPVVATALQFQVQPSNAVAATPIAPPVQVRIVDANNATVTSATNTVTIAIGTNPANGTLSGTLSAAAVNGVATFANLSVDNAGTGYTLTAAATGLTGATSTAFDVVAASNNRTWTGAVSTNWSVAGNWSGGGVPTSANNAIIPAGTPNQPALTTGVQINDVTIAAGATLAIGPFNLVSSGNIDATGPITGQGVVVFVGQGRTLRGSVPNVLVNGSASINGATSIGGGLVIGSGATFSITGNAVSIVDVAVNSGTLSIGAGASVATSTVNVLGTGIYEQTGGNVTVSSNALFNGGSSAGRITGGTLAIAGNFTQMATNNAQSFVASGTHRTVFASASAQQINIASPAQTRFADLELVGPGVITANAAITATGQLISPAGATTLNGGGATITAAGLNVNGLTLDNAPLVSTNGTIAAFDNVTMQNYSGAITPLRITHPGAAQPFTFNNTQFLVTPTSGAYLDVTDANPSDGLALTITLVNSTPANGAAQTATSGGAVVNWGGGSATIAWTNASGGTWSNPANWSLNRVPQSSDSVVIALSGTYTVDLDTTFTASYITVGGASGTQTLQLQARTLTIDNAVTIKTNAIFNVIGGSNVTGAGSLVVQQTLFLVSSTISAPLIHQGLTVARGASAIQGPVTTTPASLIRMQGDNNIGNSTLTVTSSFVNNGQIELTTIGGAFAAALVGNTVTNASGATITSVPGAGGGRSITATIVNQGSIVVNEPLTINRNTAAHTNSGTITLTGGDLAYAFTTGSINNTGTITIGSGRTLSLSGGTLTHNGTIAGSGTLALQSATLSLGTNFTSAATLLTATSSTIAGSVTLTNAVGRQMSFTNVTTGSLLTIVNQGTLLVSATTQLNGPLTNAAGSVLRVQGNNTIGNTLLTVTNGFTNEGQIDLTTIGGGFAAALTVTDGTLINATGGTITSSAGAGGGRTLTAELDNRGTLTINQALTMNRGSSAHVNTGTIDLAGGDLALNQGGTSPSFTNSGALTIGAGRTLTVSTGAFNQSVGTIGGAGTLSLQSANATFATNFTNATTALVISSSAINGPGIITNAAGRSLTLASSIIASTSGLVNQGAFLATGTSAVDGPITTAAGSSITVQGNGTVGNATLTVANGFDNRGTIDLTTVGGGFTPTLTVTSGALANLSGATIVSSVGANGPRVLNAQLDNRLGGTVTVAQPLTMGRANSAHVNAGAIDLTTGDLTIAQSGTSRSFTNANQGTIAIGSGRTLTVSGGDFTQATGASVSGAGTLSLASTAATFHTQLSVGALTTTGSTVSFLDGLTTTGMTTSFSTSTITSPMNIENVAGRQMTLNGSTIGGADGFSNAGTLLATGTSGINNNFFTQPGSLLRLQGNSAVGNSTLTVANDFQNNGTIELTTIGGGFSSELDVTNGSLTNASTGLITSLVGAGGPRVLRAQLVNDAGGTVNVDQPLSVNRSASSHVNNGLISINGTASLTIVQTGSGASFANGGTAAVAPGATLAVTNGTFTVSGSGNLNGGGTFSMTGGTASFGNPFTLSAMNLTTVNATFTGAISTSGLALTFTNSVINGPATFNNIATQTLTSVGTNFAANVSINNQGTFASSGGTVINGPYTAAAGSTLRAQGNGTSGNATVTFANGFTNNGLIDLTTAGGGFTVTVNIAGGTLTNSNTGTIASAVGAGGPRILNAQLVNQSGGTVTVAQDLTMSRGSTTYTNAGLMNLTTGNLTLAQSAGFGMTNTGTITVGTGRTFTVNNGTFTQSNGATLNGGGGLTVTGAATATMNSTFTLSNLDVIGGSTLTLGQSISTAGLTVNVANSTVNSSGNFNIANAAGQTMTVRASTVSVGIVSVSNAGTLIVEGASNFGNTVSNVGTIRVEGSSAAGNATMTTASLNNNSGGVVELTTATAGFTGAVTTTSGFSNNAGGTITAIGGNRAINGNVTNAGTINMSSGASTGILTIFGNLSNSGALNFRISQFGGIYDQLQVTGTLTLGAATPAGSVNVSLTTPFTPSPGTQYQLITNYTSRVGTFAAFNTPTPGWGNSYGTTINVIAP